MLLNQPYQPRLCVCNSKESLVHDEASKANLDAYKRIIKWQPFFEQVYDDDNNSDNENEMETRKKEEVGKRRKKRSAKEKEDKTLASLTIPINLNKN